SFAVGLVGDLELRAGVDRGDDVVVIARPLTDVEIGCCEHRARRFRRRLGSLARAGGRLLRGLRLGSQALALLIAARTLVGRARPCVGGGLFGRAFWLAL